MRRLLIILLLCVSCSTEEEPACNEELTMQKLNQGFDNMLKQGVEDEAQIEAWRAEAMNDPCGYWEQEFDSEPPK